MKIIVLTFVMACMSSLVLGFGGLGSSQKTHKVTSSSRTSLQMGFFDDIQKMFKSLTMRADASHILIKGGAEAANKLEDLKKEIANNPVSFAEAAATYSECPSSRQGGNLGEFGPGQMVKEFDKVVFSDDVGIVHGPIKTQFGYHLILINSRSD